MKINFARRFVLRDGESRLLANFLANAPRQPGQTPPAAIIAEHTPLQRVAWYAGTWLSHGTARAFTIRVRTTTIDIEYTDVTAERPSEPRIGRSVSLDHAAQMLGVSRRTIYNRIRDGRLQTIRTVGGSQRVLLESVTDRRSRAGAFVRRSTV